MANSGDFFVMLNTQDGGYAPMMFDDDIAKYDTSGKAYNAAENNVLGDMFGFEVFEIGAGVAQG